ncbi:polysaccharide lyase [Blastococcus xanthinilyticus]|uniref:Polysaccharide lyase-like protein n=1 Tax=Blastococcus xanthinilyticus TaxID=1564164 RepID=A0A5S5CVS4_9ACTN|nr:polysaccharide lyase [Blastococcus xanthinilyticus]TYP87194.1 polysaccharide lyase-like protein [Blastococcus xanthinilyticus]
MTRGRRRIPLALAVSVSLTLAACGSDDPRPSGSDPTVATAEPPSTPIETTEVPRSELDPVATDQFSTSRSTSSAPTTSPTLDDPRRPDQVWSYDDGTLSAWSEVHAARPEQVRVVDEPVRPGYEHSGAFSARPGDFTFGVDTTIRGEVRSTIEEAGSPEEGDVQWYSWSTYFPEDFRWDGRDEFLIYTQWHQTANTGSPNIDLWVTDGDQPELRMSVRGGVLGEERVEHTAVYDLGPLERGEWLDHTVRIKWSTDPDEGSTRVWIDGEQVVDAAAANLYEGQSAYLKQGIYAANNTRREHTVYFSDALRGDTREAVALEPAAD